MRCSISSTFRHPFGRLTFSFAAGKTKEREKEKGKNSSDVYISWPEVAQKKNPKETFYFRCSAHTHTNTHYLPLSFAAVLSLFLSTSLSVSVSLIFSRKTTLICGAHEADSAITLAISSDYMRCLLQWRFRFHYTICAFAFASWFRRTTFSHSSSLWCAASSFSLFSLCGGFSFSGFAFKLFCWNSSGKFLSFSSSAFYSTWICAKHSLEIALQVRVCVCECAGVRQCVPHVLHVVLKFSV